MVIPAGTRRDFLLVRYPVSVDQNLDELVRFLDFLVVVPRHCRTFRQGVIGRRRCLHHSLEILETVRHSHSPEFAVSNERSQTIGQTTAVVELCDPRQLGLDRFELPSPVTGFSWFFVTQHLIKL